MPERSRTPKRTTGEATRKKKMRPGQRVRVVKDVYTPRIWMWWVMILLLLELIGFCTCQPPSQGRRSGIFAGFSLVKLEEDPEVGSDGVSYFFQNDLN